MKLARIVVLLPLMLQPLRAQEAQEAVAPRKPPILYRIQAGDLNGSGTFEVVHWDSESRMLRILDYSRPEPEVLTSHVLENFPTIMRIADLDGDGRGELIIGEGLRGYNPAEGPQTDVHLRIYRPLEQGGWKPVEVYRHKTERPQVTSLEVADLDGDGRMEILFSYFAEKYQVDLRAAYNRGGTWDVDLLPRVRMGMHVTSGKLLEGTRRTIVVGRPYGEGTQELGGAFMLDGAARIELPSYRGISSVVVGDLAGDGQSEIVVGDGWHSDYGKVARARIAIIRRVNGQWNYQLLEDVPEHTRIREIALVDLDKDGVQEIVAHGERKNSLGGDVRLYQWTSSGWRGTTLARDVQGYAVGAFKGSGKPELICTGTDPQRLDLDLHRVAWDARLAGAVDTYKVNPADLIDKLAPSIQATSWVGSEPLSLNSLHGKVVLVDFWATWCTPCIATFPVLREWLTRYGPRGLVIIGVTSHSRQTSEQVRIFAEKEKLPWPVAIDPNDRTQMDYGVSPIPHSFLIDREGILRYSHIGGGSLEQIEKQIETLLGPTLP